MCYAKISVSLQGKWKFEILIVENRGGHIEQPLKTIENAHDLYKKISIDLYAACTDSKILVYRLRGEDEKSSRITTTTENMEQGYGCCDISMTISTYINALSHFIYKTNTQKKRLPTLLHLCKLCYTRF
jgi:uncharacterized protein with von Willebrand factor type A (vWA) domain